MLPVILSKCPYRFSDRGTDNPCSAQPRVCCLDAEPEGTRSLWLELAAIPSASPKVWMDAYLAAFAIRAGLPFATMDTDFRRFETAGLELQLLSA